MAKDPAFLFYYQDWLVGTYFLNRREKGAYMDLLCYQADKGTLTLQTIKEILNGDFECWKKLQEKFIEEDGVFYNKRLRIEKEKRAKHITNQSENAKKRWNKNECRGNAVAMPLEDENENENENKDLRIERCEIEFKSEVFEFAEKYPESMLDKFCNYWTEKNKSKTKMRFELEKTFEISKRLATWASRDTEIIKTEQPLSYDEILKKSETDPGIWKRYKSVKKEGERKAIFIPINP